MVSAEQEDYPRYRLRLFFSVDLVGSTAFKAGDGKNSAKGSHSQPLWVETTRAFYQEFPRLVERKFDFREHEHLKGLHPQVWKTVGDEIVFYCRVQDTIHLEKSMRAFLQALNDYGRNLHNKAIGGNYSGLDLKGAAWLAAFPHPNVTVALNSDSLSVDQFGDKFESKADVSPHAIDFLGNGIDTGFRISSCSNSGRCALSAELAYLLVSPEISPVFEFCHYERVPLKGVLRGTPYPVFCLQTERSGSKRTLLANERTLLGKPALDNVHIRTFLTQFMAEERLDEPALPVPGGSVPFPASYLEFKDLWLRDAAVERQRKELEVSGEDPVNSGGSDIPTVVSTFAEKAPRATSNPDAE